MYAYIFIHMAPGVSAAGSKAAWQGNLPIDLSIWIKIYIYIYISIYLSIYLSLYLSVSIYICTYVTYICRYIRYPDISIFRPIHSLPLDYIWEEGVINCCQLSSVIPIFCRWNIHRHHSIMHPFYLGVKSLPLLLWCGWEKWICSSNWLSIHRDHGYNP